MNAHDGVGLVVLSREELLELGLSDLPLPLVEVALQILFDSLSLARPFDERARLFLAMTELVDDVDLGLEVAPLAGELLPFRGIGPDARVGELLF
jgi:hypothetical protein